MSTSPTVQDHLNTLNQLIAQVAIGRFDLDLPIPKDEDEFTETYVGIQLMLEVIREKIADFNLQATNLASEKKQLQTLIDALPIGIFIAAVPSGKPITVNQRTQELFNGYYNPDVGIESYTTAYHLTTATGKPYPDSEHPIASTLKTGLGTTKRDMYLQLPQSKPIALKVTSVPVHDTTGKLTSILAVFDDISQEKALDKAKDEFLSIAAHQLRSPLGSTRWQLEMLLDGDFGPIPEELFPTLNSLRDQNLHLIHLVENLLNLARIEAGKQTDHPEPTHLVEVVQRCFEILEPHAQDRHITLKLEILSIPHPTVNLDPEKLTEIFQNLLTNAVKYNNPGGSVTVTISPQVQFVVVTITDTGIGISEVDQPKLFTKFFRTEAASRYDTEGTGLGLYVVKSYIEAWGGSIKVTSREWQGSTFTLTLPYQPQTV